MHEKAEGEPAPESAADDGAVPPRHLIRALVRAVAADPEYLAERLTVFAVEWWGPHADRRAGELRRQRPDTEAEDLRQTTVTRSVRTCLSEGAFIGGPFVVLIPFAFCGALLVQIRMILELAALTGRPATAPERAPEVLVILGVQPDVGAAREALAAAKTRKAERTPDERAWPRRMWSALWRMMRLLGLLTPDPETEPSRLVRAGRWVVLIGTFAVGTVLPLIWLPYMAVAYRGSTLEVANRATAAYYGPAGLQPAERSGIARPGMIAAGIRVAISVVLIAAAVVTFILLGLNVIGGRWPTLILTLVVVSLASGVWWFWRRHRARRRASGP